MALFKSLKIKLPILADLTDAHSPDTCDGNYHISILPVSYN